MQFEEVKEFIVNKLKNELPAYLTYHTIEHVMDVYQAAENIGKIQHVNEYDMHLLLTAVLFHDIGFIEGAPRHEERSSALARQILPAYGYTTDEINRIDGLIMATRIPQSPKNQLEEIICDADLDYLGRDDFFPNGDKLYVELCDAGVITNQNDWNKLQVSFLESHRYFTDTSIKLRQPEKNKHLEEVRLKIK
jgi:hypothetical protein